ncbi:MAG: hypothetical protein V8S08_04770 [Lachnoclostridium sp.]
MEKLDYTKEQIEEYKQRNRRYFVIRESEISEAIENGEYRSAIKVLEESKELDAGNAEQLKKYSEQLIDLYNKLNMSAEYAKELEHYIISFFWQYDLRYVYRLKKCIESEAQWSKLVDDIVKKK